MDNSELIKSVTDYEQRIFIKICVLFEPNAANIHRMLKKALGNNSYSQQHVRTLVKEIRDGRTDMNDQRVVLIV